MSISKTINELVEYLNVCRDAYYNKNTSIITDEQYDKLFDELVELEKESGIILSNSPTQTVGYEVKSDLQKVEHTYPLLSLDKTKSYSDVVKFCGNKDVLFMYKVDGLTCQLTYENGDLVRAETRGDGFIGEDITHNALTFIGVPKHIPYSGTVKVTGEAVINRQDFIEINSSLDDVYKNPRNLASGSVRQLDSSICAKRKVRFIVWNANELSTNGTMFDGLMKAYDVGFNIVHMTTVQNSKTEEQLETIFNNIKEHTKTDYIPIDGIVIMFDNIEYGKSLGKTAHHFRNGLAFKFYDDTYETTLNDIEFTIGKTGVLTPTAIFDPVEIAGTTVTRASVHNISILRELNLCKDDDIEVYKANEIIPQIKRNNTKHSVKDAFMTLIPTSCPYCGEPVQIITNTDSGVDNLYCVNVKCKGILLKKLSAFVSKQALNIDGLSERTLEKLIDLGYVKSYMDIFTEIEAHKNDIASLSGFGEKSVQGILDAINTAKTTTLDKVFTAFNIDGVGKQIAVELAKYFNNSAENVLNTNIKDNVTEYNNLYNNLSKIDGFGDTLCTTICDWFNSSEYDDLCEVLKLMTIKETTKKTTTLSGMNFVITGKLNQFKKRDDLVKTITDNGGTVQSGVTQKTTYLINNDVNSTSGKNKTAKELGIKIIGEEDFMKLLSGETPEFKPMRKSLF